MEILTIYINDLSSEFRDKLGKFLEEGFSADSRSLWLSRFKYWWDSNPYLTDTTPVGWIIVDDDNELVGFMGNIPHQFKYQQDELSAVASTSWYVRENIRGTVSSPIYLLFSRQKATIFINTTPLKSIERSLLVQKFKCINCCSGVMNYHAITNYMIIISLGSFSKVIATLSSHFSESETGALKRAFEIGSKFARITGKILPKAKEKKNRSILSSDSYNIQIVTCSEDFIEKLPQHLKGDTIEFSKDKTTLDWMFFSSEVQNLLQRTVAQIYSKTGKYFGYFIYDRQHVGTELLLRLRELQLLKPDADAVKLIIAHLKQEAKIHGCAAVYSGLQRPDADVDKLLSKRILLKIKTEGRYYVKFRKNAIEGIDNPYAIFVPSDLDPDVGFI